MTDQERIQKKAFNVAQAIPLQTLQAIQNRIGLLVATEAPFHEAKRQLLMVVTEA